MALPTTLKFSKLLVLLEDPATPGVYASPCGFSSKSFEISKSLTDSTVPDCVNVDDPAWIGREVASQSATVSGDGVLALESLGTWRKFMQDTSSWNVRIEIVGPTPGVGGGYYSGKFHCESLSIGAELGEKLSCGVSMSSDGELTWTDV